MGEGKSSHFCDNNVTPKIQTYMYIQVTCTCIVTSKASANHLVWVLQLYLVDVVCAGIIKGPVAVCT